MSLKQPTPHVPLEWKFCQSFGDDNSSDDDLVTAVEFDEKGEFLAVGDKAGRICIFEGRPPQGPNEFLEYKFYNEFQSHEREFDCLKSLEIEERINMIKWYGRNRHGLFLLATNDKTVKLWKIHDKRIWEPPSVIRQGHLSLPPSNSFESLTTASVKRVYGNAHQYHINSVSINSDGETFLSSDDLRINLWNMENKKESWTIVDVKPPDLEKLTEVITSASFHPQMCNIFMYSTSRGSIRLADMRDSALCDQHSKQFEIEEDAANRSFFSEIISSISDAKFSNDGRYIISRDYLTLKLWDINMERRPVATVNIHEYLKTHLCDLYENDCIFDKFECDMSGDGTQIVSGSYHNNFMIHDVSREESVTVEAMQDSPKPRPAGKPEPSPNVQMIDFEKKALHTAWHPQMDAVAVAGVNKLYIYQGCKPEINIS